MRRNIIITMLLLAAFVGSCSSVDPNIEPNVGTEGTDEIVFGTDVDWATRGDVIDKVAELKLLTYFVDGAKWDEVASVNQLGSYFQATSPDWITLTADATGNLSYEGGVRYWPTGANQRLNFFAMAPESELTPTYDATTGKPQFSYTLDPFADNNKDLIFDAKYDMTASNSNNGRVDFELQHLLTRLSLEVKLSGSTNDGIGIVTGQGSTTEDTNEYRVAGVTFYGLYDNATLNIDIEDDGSRTLTWDVVKDNDNTIDLTASRGGTIKPFPVDRDNINTEADEAPALTTADFTDVMAKGKSIFVLPQSLGATREDDTGDNGIAPTVQIRIRRSYKAKSTSTTYSEIMYASEIVKVPTSTGSTGWEAGQWNNLQFTFDLSRLSEYDTPLTLFSEVRPWTETNVDVDVHRNLYIYASDSEMSAAETAEYADFCIFTNYKYDLRLHRRKYELDNSTYTESDGFSFYVVDDSSIKLDASGVVVPNSWTELAHIDPVFLWNGDKTGFKKNDDYDPELLTQYEAFYEDGNADTSDFQDSDGWMYFVLQSDPGDPSRVFYYKVKRTTRDEAHLYTNTSVDEDYSDGINKRGTDAVYIMRLLIIDEHLKKNDAVKKDYGYFFGKIGAEAISDGGGLLTAKFRVTLEKSLK